MSGLRNVSDSISDGAENGESPSPSESDQPAFAPKSPSRDAAAWQDEAQRLARLGRWEDALASYGKALAIDPEKALAFYGRGLCLSALGRVEEAIASYERAVCIDSHLEAAWFSKALAEEQAGRTQDAIQSFERYAAVASAKDEAQIEYARRRLEELGSGQGRKSAAPASTDLNPIRPSPHSSSGRAAALDDERRVFVTPNRVAGDNLSSRDRAQRFAPQRATAWYNRGVSLAAQGLQEEALACYDRALALDPEDAAAWNNKALCLVSLGRLVEANACYDRALTLSPHLAAAWNNKGLCLAALDRIEEAIACDDRALDLDPQLAYTWYHKAICLAHVKRWEEAIVCYDRALALDPEDSTSWFNKAVAERIVGRQQEAMRSYERFKAVAQVARNRQQLRKPTPHISADKYKELDHIGDFEVQGVLGRGGFGVVYLVHVPVFADASLRASPREFSDRHGRRIKTYQEYALKTFRDDYVDDPQVRQRFRHEAQLLVDLESHPHVLRVLFVQEIAGRLYMAAEYISPNDEGLNSLDGYLRRCPPDLVQSLRWAIQVCHGMEHAYGQGLRCHRDLKPANILVTQDRMVKIADFGLAAVLDQVQLADGIQMHVEDGRVELSGQTVEGAGFGTPTHMPPEQFTNAASCDERSDVYAFGVVLYQMATKGQVPFLAPLPRNDSLTEKKRFWSEMQRLHTTAAVAQLDSPLFPIISRCLAKRQPERYQSFRQIREELEHVLRREAGEVVTVAAAGDLEWWEWVFKGRSQASLRRWEEAIVCYDRALALNPQNEEAWNNKGLCLAALGRLEEANACYSQALVHDPKYAPAWFNRALGEDQVGRRRDAVRSYKHFLAAASSQHAAQIKHARQRLRELRRQ